MIHYIRVCNPHARVGAITSHQTGICQVGIRPICEIHGGAAYISVRYSKQTLEDDLTQKKRSFGNGIPKDVTYNISIRDVRQYRGYGQLFVIIMYCSELENRSKGNTITHSRFDPNPYNDKT
jgi:hypothetical protein